MRCVWDAEVQGSNPCTPTNLKLLPVELALGLRNRVANVRFIPRVPLYGVCSITGNAQGCEPCRCGIEARHTPQICPISIMDSAVDFYSIDQGSTP